MPTARTNINRFVNLITKIDDIKPVTSIHVTVFNDGDSYSDATIRVGNAGHMEWIKIRLKSTASDQVIVEPRIFSANLYGDTYKPVAGQLAPNARIVDACASCERFTINIARFEQLKQLLAALSIELVIEVKS
jgi:hypothetical protein